MYKTYLDEPAAMKPSLDKMELFVCCLYYSVTVAYHQGVIRVLWPHFRAALVSSIFIYSLLTVLGILSRSRKSNFLLVGSKENLHPLTTVVATTS